MISLRRIKAFLYNIYGYTDTFPWFCRTLRSGYATGVSRQLEDISINVLPFHSEELKSWKDILNVLLEDEFKNLKNLNISLEDPTMTSESVEIVQQLDSWWEIEMLRRNIVVDVKCRFNTLHKMLC